MKYAHFFRIITDMALKTANSDINPPILTSREQEVFDKLLAGTTGKEIAEELKISYDTFSYHRKKLYKKLGVSNIMELFTKYKTGSRVIPVNVVLEDGAGAKSGFPLKIIIPAAVAVFTVVFTIVWLSAQNKNDLFIPTIDPWYAICDSMSSSQISRIDEEIDGKTKSVFTISGFLFNDEEAPRYEGFYASLDMPFAGAFGRVFGDSLEAIRKMKSMSFKILGDGNKYYIRFPTFETIEGDHHIYIFESVKDEIMDININIPGDIRRFGWSGKDVAFIQNNIMFLQIQAAEPGDFSLKIWDIRFNK